MEATGDREEGAWRTGHNGGGDKLVLLADPATDQYRDAVYWWDHETGEVNQVADAFEELCGEPGQATA